MNVNPSNFYENFYFNYSSSLNKDNIFSNLRQTSLQEEQQTLKTQVVEETPKVEEPRNISKEEATALLYQYQATQIMKENIDTYFDENTEEEEELDLQDFRDMNKALNRAELIRYYENEERLRIQEDDDFHTQLWA